MKGLVHKYDKVIIGATFESLLYALYTKTPVFYVVPKIPTEFDSVTIGSNYKIVSILPELKDVVSNYDETLIRPQKNVIWGRLVFLLSMLGLMPSTNLQSIRIEENLVKLTTQNSRLITLETNEILLFDDEGIEGLNPPIVEKTKYIIKDYVEFNNLKFLDKSYNVIYTDYTIANQIWFLESKTLIRDYDGCIVSFCSDPKELEENLTDYNIKFILKEQFKKYNLKGKENGYNPNGNKKHRPVAYTFLNRIIEKENCNIYEDTSYVKFINYSSQEIMMMFEKIPYREYMLCRKLLRISLQRRKSRTSRASYRLQEKN